MAHTYFKAYLNKTDFSINHLRLNLSFPFLTFLQRHFLFIVSIFHFPQTYQYYKDKAYRGSIVGLGISGEFKVAATIKHGFLPIGVSRMVTKSKDLTLQELDGKPASSIYQDYFGEEHLHELHEGLLPSLAVSYPLGVFLPESNNVILRNPVSVDKNGTMRFTSAIPASCRIWLKGAGGWT